MAEVHTEMYHYALYYNNKLLWPERGEMIQIKLMLIMAVRN